MSVRSQTLYVSPRTMKRLGLTLLLYPQRGKGAGPAIKGQLFHDMTRDELADNLLNEAIETRYPLVTGLEAELKKVESEFFTKHLKKS